MTSVNQGPSSSSSPNNLPVVYTPATQGLAAGSTALGPFATQAGLLTANARIAGAAIPKTLTVAATPTIVTNSTPMGSAQLMKAVPNFQPPPNPAFTFALPSASIVSLGSGGTAQYTALVGDTPAGGAITCFGVSFYHSGSQLDIIKFQSGQPFALWIDDLYIGYFCQPFASGTAAAGGANTITLAAGSSAVDGFYNGFTVTQGAVHGMITAYVGATKVATVSAGTYSAATYTIVDDANGYQLLSGVLSYVNIQFPAAGTRKIEVFGNDFQGINIGPNDSLWPAPIDATTRLILIGDSQFTVNFGPHTVSPPSWAMLGRACGCQLYVDGEAGTGFAYDSGSGRLSYLDRIAPPPEAWWISFIQASGGTFTLSVTYNGVTQTTSALAFNIGFAAIKTALQGLSNIPAGAVIAVATAGGVASLSFIILLKNMTGANLTANFASLTGTINPGQPFVRNWLGVVAPRVPLDGGGNPLPFLLIVHGSSNDSTGNGVTTSLLQSTATAVAQAIVSRFPSAICVFVGVYWITTFTGDGIIGATDLARNAAIAAGAAFLTPVNGNVPFIDTYAAGLGGKAWVFGTGSISAPTVNTNDILISVATAAHPTGNGQHLLATRLMQNLKVLLGAV